MADQKDGGDKTEQPTSKRLADARKKGDVAKSRDVTATVGLLVWLLIFMFGVGFAGDRISTLFEGSFEMVSQGRPFETAVASLGWASFSTMLLLTGVALVPAAAVGTLVEFLQAGSVMSMDKLKPSLDKLNPMAGLKRMFSLDNLVELAKTLAKAILILFVAWLVLRGSLGEVLGNLGPGVLPTAPGTGRSEAAMVLDVTGDLAWRLVGWTLSVFLLVAILDMAWQRHSYIKKLRMSRRDIRDEIKENEGDPYIKSNRKQMHQEWANQNAVGSARKSAVLVVNPTHIAIALDYDPDDCPIPIIAAKGEGPLAAAMRAAAEEADVPIVRNVEVARALLDRGVVEEVVPRDMFDAIAEIIIWAKRAREELIAARTARAEG